jgi:FtsP/CotA-like multicopper oxidase with cupredoxin domain
MKQSESVCWEQVMKIRFRPQTGNRRTVARLIRPLAALWACMVLFAPGTMVSAATVEYDLTIARQEVNLTGSPVQAMTVNGQLPGPTLRFTEGDRAVIRVHNQMDVETSIHWHGLLLPNAMDGVPFVTQPPIAPGETFTYEFDLRQSGTYWYHSHTALQEQRGLFGAFVITPKSAGEYDGLREHVVVLSDWTDEDADAVLQTLKRGSEWYSIRKGSGQSILGAARVGKLGAYFSRELQRMPPMDIADVYYDRFLLNGAPQQALAAEPGERIRLRIIDGSASTFFYLEYAGGPMQVISADGLPVQPFDEKRLLIGIAETYDVIVTVPPDGSYELRATAHDSSGHSSLWIGSGPPHPRRTSRIPISTTPWAAFRSTACSRSRQPRRWACPTAKCVPAHSTSQARTGWRTWIMLKWTTAAQPGASHPPNPQWTMVTMTSARCRRRISQWIPAHRRARGSACSLMM